MPSPDAPGRQGQRGLFLRRQPVLARQRRMLVPRRGGQRVESGTAAQLSISREQRPPSLSLAEQDRPVRRRLVRASNDVHTGCAETGSVRMQKLLEAPPFREHATQEGVPVRPVAEEPREPALAQAPGHRVAKDGPAIAAPAPGIEKIDVQRPSLRIEKEVTPVDGQVLEEGRKRERHLGAYPASHQRDVLPAPVDLPQNPQAPAVGRPHQDEPSHSESRRQTTLARLGFSQRNGPIFRQIPAQVSTARLADQIHLQPLAPLHPPKLLQLPTQQPGALGQVPPPVIGEEEEALPRPRRLQIPLHVSRSGEELPDRPVNRLMDDAEEGELLDRGHGLEDRQTGILVHEGQSQPVAVVVRPQQVPAGPPGDLAGLGVPEDDAGDSGNEDNGDGWRLGRRLFGTDAGRRPRAAGGEQEDDEERKRQSRSPQNTLLNLPRFRGSLRQITAAVKDGQNHAERNLCFTCS